MVDATVSHDLDVRSALLASGWASSAGTRGRTLQVFSLDEASIRVIEYKPKGSGDDSSGLVKAEVPAKVWMGFLDGVSTFDNKTQPDIHVAWVLPGETRPGETRYFMVYLDTTANGKKESATYGEGATAPLDARYWIGRGTTLYGAAQTVGIVGLEDGTTAYIDVYDDSGHVRRLRDEPFKVGRGARITATATTGAAVLVRVTSDKPILAFGPDLFGRAMGPVPSLDSGLLGSKFLFDSGRSPFTIMALTGASNVVLKAMPNNTEIARIELGPSAPMKTVDPSGANLVYIEASAPILITMWPVSGKSQFVSSWGAPTGSRLFGYPWAGGLCPNGSRECPGLYPPCEVRGPSDRYLFHGGEYVVSGLGETVNFWGRGASGELVLPTQRGGTELASTSGRAEVGQMERHLAVPGRGTEGVDRCPVLFHVTSDSNSHDIAPKGRLAVFGGSPSSGAADPLVTPVGGAAGSRFEVLWPVNVVALHNGTQIRVMDHGSVKATALKSTGEVHKVPNDYRTTLRIEATKPVIVVPTSAGGYFASVDRSLRAEPGGPAEYRGFLLNIAPKEGSQEPMVGLVGPGKEATFRLLVTNLAKDYRGRDADDTVRLELPPLPDGWEASVSPTIVHLRGGGSAEVELRVTAPTDVKEGARLAIAISATSSGNPAIADRVPILTLVRASYGVDLWFDREQGPKSRTLTADPGKQEVVALVVKNLASIPDRLLVTVSPLSTDWAAVFPVTGTRFQEVELDPGGVATLRLAVVAPETAASQSIVEVVATSVSDASASTKIAAIVRIRPDIRIALHVPEPTLEALPGTEAHFRVGFQNNGNEQVGIRFNTTGVRPPDWSRPVIKFGPYEVSELSGLAPATTTELDVSVPVPGTALRTDLVRVAFQVETMPQFIGDEVLQENVELVVIVGARHALFQSYQAPVVALDRGGRAYAQVNIRNDGNGDEQIRLVPSVLPPGSAFLSDARVTIPVHGSATISGVVSLPLATEAGTYPVVIEFVIDGVPRSEWGFNVSVAERRLGVLIPQSPSWSAPGRPVDVVYEARNDGNVPLSMPPAIDGPTGWQLAWAEPHSPLGPGEARLETLRVTAERNTPAGSYFLQPVGSWMGAGPLDWEIRDVRLSVEIGTIDDADGTVEVFVTNGGAGDAFSVPVELVVDGEPADRLILQRVPAGGRLSAILFAPPGTGSSAVVVDPAALYADQPLVVALQPPNRGTAVSGPGVVGTVLAVSLIAAHVATRRNDR
ncbi:MAG: hypothetical protein HY556_10545 [Euryarchaeota archaeon]|nr:hypothetical protein [Euryarchaeota archaeon]